MVTRLETPDRLKDPRGSFHSRKTVDLDWGAFRDFRHFRGSQWVMSGIDIKTVQELMGHSDIQTTLLYVQVTPQDVYLEYARAVAQHIRPVPGKLS